MSQSPDFSANLVVDKLNEDMWSISDPLGQLGIGFW